MVVMICFFGFGIVVYFEYEGLVEGVEFEIDGIVDEWFGGGEFDDEFRNDVDFVEFGGKIGWLLSGEKK